MKERHTDLYQIASQPLPSETEVFAALRRCYDPCCREKGISVVDMGLIDSIHVAGSNVRIDMILTSGWCPFAMHLLTDVERAVTELAGVEHVDVNIVWEPTWTPERLSPDARKKLALPMEKLLPLREARLRSDQETNSENRTTAP